MMIKRSAKEVADIIERFVDGGGGQWDWDDFCSTPIADPKLESVRGICTNLCFTHPPSELGHFCSKAGVLLMREIVQNLRTG
jgi:hypothetical protein